MYCYFINTIIQGSFKINNTPVDRGLHSNPSVALVDPVDSGTELELADVCNGQTTTKWQSIGSVCCTVHVKNKHIVYNHVPHAWFLFISKIFS